MGGGGGAGAHPRGLFQKRTATRSEPALPPVGGWDESWRDSALARTQGAGPAGLVAGTGPSPSGKRVTSSSDTRGAAALWGGHFPRGC